MHSLRRHVEIELESTVSWNSLTESCRFQICRQERKEKSGDVARGENKCGDEVIGLLARYIV